MHRALAEATDANADPDRRAWHRAQAALGPDEDLAAELERSARRAQSRGGMAAAAAFLERAAVLTPDPGGRARRALAAARAHQLAGAPEAASALLDTASSGLLDELDQAMLEQLRGRIALHLSRSGEAAALLLDAARRLAALDPGLARDTHLESLYAVRRRPSRRWHGNGGPGRRRRPAAAWAAARRRSAARRSGPALHRRVPRERADAQACAVCVS